MAMQSKQKVFIYLNFTQMLHFYLFDIVCVKWIRNTQNKKYHSKYYSNVLVLGVFNILSLNKIFCLEKYPCSFPLKNNVHMIHELSVTSSLCFSLEDTKTIQVLTF